MKLSTVTEAGAELIHRGLKFAEADIIKFRTSAEARGFKHTVEECNDQLRILRGNGTEPGLLSQFAPQLDAFDAGRLDGSGGEDAGGQLALEDNIVDPATDPNTSWADYVPRPRPKVGDAIVFPDGSTAKVITPVGWLKEREVFEVRMLEEGADEDMPTSKLHIIWENNEWRDSDIAAEDGYAERNESQIASAQRKLGEDTATDADVPVNSESPQGDALDRLGAAADSSSSQISKLADAVERKRAPKASRNPLHHKDSFKQPGDKKAKAGSKSKAKAQRKGGRS